jgi:hypothetical protein
MIVIDRSYDRSGYVINKTGAIFCYYIIQIANNSVWCVLYCCYFSYYVAYCLLLFGLLIAFSSLIFLIICLYYLKGSTPSLWGFAPTHFCFANRFWSHPFLLYEVGFDCQVSRACRTRISSWPTGMCQSASEDAYLTYLHPFIWIGLLFLYYFQFLSSSQVSTSHCGIPIWNRDQ